MAQVSKVPVSRLVKQVGDEGPAKKSRDEYRKEINQFQLLILMTFSRFRFDIRKSFTVNIPNENKVDF